MPPSRPASILLTVFVVLLLLFGTGCASMLPIGGAMVGAGGGALGGPGTAALGAGAGYGLGEMGRQSIEGKDIENDIDRIGRQVDALSRGDVDALIAARFDEEEGFFDGMVNDLYELLKVCGIIGALLFLVPILYTWHRKRKALPFYESIGRMAEEFEDVKRKLQ